MKPVWTKPPTLKIKSTHNPQEGLSLSGVVVIRDEIGHGSCHIKFPPETQHRIAKRMPRGIGPAEPAYLHIELEDGLYAIYCMYVECLEGIVLWRQEKLPDWVGYIKRPQL